MSLFLMVKATVERREKFHEEGFLVCIEGVLRCTLFEVPLVLLDICRAGRDASRADDEFCIVRTAAGVVAVGQGEAAVGFPFGCNAVGGDGWRFVGRLGCLPSGLPGCGAGDWRISLVEVGFQHVKPAVGTFDDAVEFAARELSASSQHGVAGIIVMIKGHVAHREELYPLATAEGTQTQLARGVEFFKGGVG